MLLAIVDMNLAPASAGGGPGWHLSIVGSPATAFPANLCSAAARSVVGHGGSSSFVDGTGTGSFPITGGAGRDPRPAGPATGRIRPAPRDRGTVIRSGGTVQHDQHLGGTDKSRPMAVAALRAA